MSTEDNLAIAQQLLEAMGSGQTPAALGLHFDEDVVVEIPGDAGALPWIGRRTGRAAIVDFFTQNSALLEREAFELRDILVSEARAAIFGTLSARVLDTNRTIETSFVIVLTIAQGRITQYLMLEDSFAVSQAARS